MCSISKLLHKDRTVFQFVFSDAFEGQEREVNPKAKQIPKPLTNKGPFVVILRINGQRYIHGVFKNNNSNMVNQFKLTSILKLFQDSVLE